MQSNTVIANDLTIYYEESGSGDPLILLHGAMGSGAHWRPYVSRFAPHNRVIIPMLAITAVPRSQRPISLVPILTALLPMS